MPFTTEELTRLRGQLPHGASIILAKEFNMKPGSIRNILCGTANNDEVVIAANKLATDYQNKLLKAKENLSNV